MSGPALDVALNKLCKWRALYAGWWFGTRPNSDPQAQAARDNFDRTIVMRCEVSAITKLLTDKGVFTIDEFKVALLAEARELDALLEKAWPGFKTSEVGLVFADMLKCAETMRERGFPG